MKILRYIAALLILASGTNLPAQNLVPNPGFEDKKRGRFTHRPWRFVNTVDMYVEGKNTSAMKQFKKKGTMPKPHGGHAYVGLRIYPDYREFIQVRLKKKLIQGKKYYFEMWISWSDRSNCYAKQFGASFYHNRPAYTAKAYVFTNPPQINLVEKHGIRQDSTEWIKISGVYRARGGERYLTIGNFSLKHRKDRLKKVHWYSVAFWHKEAYYFVDDVLLIQLEDDFDRKEPMLSVDSTVTVPDTIQYDILKENYVYAIDEKKSIQMKNIRFESGKAELLPSSYRDLELVLEYLNENPAAKIQIIGHTDDVGSEESNLRLSEKRAKTVYQFFVKNKIDKTRLSYLGKGESEPLVPNDKPGRRAKNRRVEIKLVENNTTSAPRPATVPAGN